MSYYFKYARENKYTGNFHLESTTETEVIEPVDLKELFDLESDLAQGVLVERTLTEQQRLLNQNEEESVLMESLGYTKGVLSQIVDDTTDIHLFQESYRGLFSTTKEASLYTAEGIGDFIKGVKDKIVEIVKKIWAWIKDKWNRFLRFLGFKGKETAKQAEDNDEKIKNAGVKEFKCNEDNIKRIKASLNASTIDIQPLLAEIMKVVANHNAGETGSTHTATLDILAVIEQWATKDKHISLQDERLQKIFILLPRDDKAPNGKVDIFERLNKVHGDRFVKGYFDSELKNYTLSYERNYCKDLSKKVISGKVANVTLIDLGNVTLFFNDSSDKYKPATSTHKGIYETHYILVIGENVEDSKTTSISVKIVMATFLLKDSGLTVKNNRVVKAVNDPLQKGTNQGSKQGVAADSTISKEDLLNLNSTLQRNAEDLNRNEPFNPGSPPEVSGNNAEAVSQMASAIKKSAESNSVNLKNLGNAGKTIEQMVVESRFENFLTQAMTEEIRESLTDKGREALIKSGDNYVKLQEDTDYNNYGHKCYFNTMDNSKIRAAFFSIKGIMSSSPTQLLEMVKDKSFYSTHCNIRPVDGVTNTDILSMIIYDIPEGTGTLKSPHDVFGVEKIKLPTSLDTEVHKVFTSTFLNKETPFRAEEVEKCIRSLPHFMLIYDIVKDNLQNDPFKDGLSTFRFCKMYNEIIENEDTLYNVIRKIKKTATINDLRDLDYLVNNNTFRQLFHSIVLAINTLKYSILFNDRYYYNFYKVKGKTPGNEDKKQIGRDYIVIYGNFRPLEPGTETTHKHALQLMGYPILSHLEKIPHIQEGMLKNIFDRLKQDRGTGEI